MTHWWGLISPKCAKGERETVQSEQEAEGKREGGEDKCNGLAIKRKVDGMHTEEQNMGKKVGRGKEEKLRICAHSTRRYSTRKGTSLSQQLECRAFSNAKFSKSRDIYLIVSSARARTAVATTAAAAAPSGLRRAKSVGRMDGEEDSLARRLRGAQTRARGVQCRYKRTNRLMKVVLICFS